MLLTKDSELQKKEIGHFRDIFRSVTVRLHCLTRILPLGCHFFDRQQLWEIRSDEKNPMLCSTVDVSIFMKPSSGHYKVIERKYVYSFV